VQELTLKKVDITSSLKNYWSILYNEQSKKKMDKNALDKVWTKHAQTYKTRWHIIFARKWFLFNGFLCLQYHCISNQHCMQVQTKPSFIAVKGTRQKEDSKARWIFIFLSLLRKWHLDVHET